MIRAADVRKFFGPSVRDTTPVMVAWEQDRYAVGQIRTEGSETDGRISFVIRDVSPLQAVEDVPLTAGEVWCDLSREDRENVRSAAPTLASCLDLEAARVAAPTREGHDVTSDEESTPEA